MDNAIIKRKTIDDLPLELKYEIFSLIDYNSLKNATLVSKQWNTEIASSKEFQSKTTLRILIHEFEPSHAFWRSYETVHVVNFRSDLMDCFHAVMDELTTFGTTLKDLHIRSVRLSDSGAVKTKLLNLLQICTSIETLRLQDWKLECFTYNDIRKDVRVEVPSLKTLEIINCNWILNHIECANLNNLDITNEISSNDREIIKFINKQTKLSSFICCGVELNSDDDFEPKCKLSEIEIDDCLAKSHQSQRNWMKLLQCAAPGARLNIEKLTRKAFNTFVKMINAVENINHLQISTKNFFKGDQRADYGSLTHITSLEISRSYDNLDFFDCHDFIAKCSNIKELAIRGGFVELSPLFIMLSKFKFLKVIKLTLYSIKYWNLDAEDIQFTPVLPHVETLEFEECISDEFIFKKMNEEVDTVQLFGKRHTTLRHVTITFTDELSSVEPIMRKLATHFPSAQTFEVKHRIGKSKQIKHRSEIQF